MQCYGNIMFYAHICTIVFVEDHQGKIITGLKLFLFLLCDCVAKFLQLMSFFCLAWYLSILKVCMSFVTTSAMQFIVSDIFAYSSGPLYRSGVLSLEIASTRYGYCP